MEEIIINLKMIHLNSHSRKLYIYLENRASKLPDYPLIYTSK